jgi:hypothetical protein
LVLSPSERFLAKVLAPSVQRRSTLHIVSIHIVSTASISPQFSPDTLAPPPGTALPTPKAIPCRWLAQDFALPTDTADLVLACGTANGLAVAAFRNIDGLAAALEVFPAPCCIRNPFQAHFTNHWRSITF